MIQQGIYRAKSVEGALGETKGGREQVAVKFRLLEVEGTITWYGYFTEKTTEGTIRSLRTAGWKGSDLTDLSDLTKEDVPEVLLVVEHENDQQGNPRAKVRWVNNANGVGMKTTLAPDKAAAFAAKMKGTILAFDKGSGKPAEANPQPKKKASDVPF